MRPVLGAAMRVAFGACGAGLGLAAASLPVHAADGEYAAPKTDRLTPTASRSGAGDGATTVITVPGQTLASRSGASITVETVTARPVDPQAAASQTPPAQPASTGTQPAPQPSDPQPKTPAEPPKTKTAALPNPAATAADDSAPGEIQWSSKKTSGATAALGMPAAKNGVIDLAIPLRDGTFYLGDINARVTSGNTASVPKERLVQMLTPLLRPAALETLKSLPAPDGHIPVTAIKAAGFDIAFDPGKIELQINPTVDQRATGRLSAGNGREQIMSENLSRPAILAGYLNMRAGVDYTTDNFYQGEGSTNARLGFDGAARWHDIVLESAATFDATDGFTRGSSRFVYDMPEEALRFSLGDVSPAKTSLQGGSDILGLSVEKSYQKLQPAASIHPTGSQSFRIERPSTVDVMVNGYVSKRLHLRPGDYDLSDLPLTTGANDISLVIEDDLGNKRTLNFSVFSGRTLLAPGISQWGMSAGVASRFNSASFKDFHNLYADIEYDFTSPAVTGYYERGLTPDLTGRTHFQADTDVLMGGGGAAFQTAFGYWSLDGAASNSFTFGAGFAANMGYELANIEGPDGVRRTFRLAAEYRSEKFATLSTADGSNDNMLSLSASYSQPLPWELNGSLSGNYTLGRDDYGDSYGADVSLGRSFGPHLSASLSAGYEVATGTRAETVTTDGFKAAVRLSYRPDAHSSIDASHDTRSGSSQLSYRQQEGNGNGAWSAQAELDRSAGVKTENDQYSVNGSLGYTGNRAEVTVSQYTGLAGLNTSAMEQRTSVTAGTAVAFADGRAAIGRPVSSGFAIIGAHPNLSGSEVAVGSAEATRASSDLLGPALLPDMSPYSPSRVSIDVTNLPVGYDLGSGAFDLYPSYKSGYVLTVGSDYTVTAFGTLTDGAGEPVALLTGEAVEEGQPQGHKVTVFTNRAGNFGAQGLRPGRWILDMATEPARTRYVLDIPKDTVGLIKLNTLKPTGTVQ